MKKLRVLLIGAAFSADLHSDGYSRIKDKVQIVGICDKAVDRIHALAQRYGFEGYEVYDDYKTAIANCDCDLVDICMPNFLHHDVAIKAMNAGKDIIWLQRTLKQHHTTQTQTLLLTVDDQNHVVWIPKKP